MSSVFYYMNTSLYCDGGVIVKNPSPYGGTWAWCLVDEFGKKMEYDSGYITPLQIGRKNISNNFTELYAAIQALKSVPRDWDGVIYTDSMITYYRLQESNSFSKITKSLREECYEIRKNRKWKVRLVKGHPNKKDLLEGFSKDGQLVSIHNVFCDNLCKKEGKKYWELENGQSERK